ncbi:glycoside hydrolase family 95 protein [Glaciibacter superstes]|uniref:glycoside hydrolase family 95 protein n=1 Tax=Glaciibacter superstes TaxID=501023 RepID=UPI0003B40B6B|nr:glycoside hydrolase family 95 protein [Glaciibacter superstes]
MTQETLRLAWDKPAVAWEDAVPIGNGRIGAMVFGGATGRLQVNDATVWSGTPDGPGRELRRVIAAGAGSERLAEIRTALDAGDVARAEDLLMSFEGPYSQEFLPFVDLAIELEGAEPVDGGPARVLDLDTAVHEERMVVGGTSVERRTWVSAPARSLVVHLAATAPVSMTIALTTPLRELDRRADGDGLVLDVEVPVDGAPLHEPDVHPALRYADDDGGDDPFDAFASAAVALTTDGTVRSDAGGLVVEGATHVLVALATSTRAEDWWVDPAGEEWRSLSRAAIRDRSVAKARATIARPVADLLLEHVLDRESASGDARFAIGGRRAGTWNVRRDVLEGKDDALAATIAAEYGRYLLVSASRAGGPAANLQGIWNGELRPAWSSNYTININTEMNYWSAPVLGLDGPFEPLIALVEKIAMTGADVARDLYGARGWVAHHNSDFWGWSLPVGRGNGAPSWAIWMMGGAWLCHNLWDAYAFSGDRELLRKRVWPLLRGAAEFCLDWLVPGPDGALRTSPSTSPENAFLGPDGNPRSLGLTATSDVVLIRALFERSLTALRDLGASDPLETELRDALRLLPPLTIGKDGRLQEWAEDVFDHEPAHRHLSALVALYPLDLISEATPALTAGAERFLDVRGSGAMGWSWAWKIALRARLSDGETAHALLGEALTAFTGETRRHGPVDGSEWGGLLPNLFSTHPPFQIDGNLGFPAAIAEMILQSHCGTVDLLPALPHAWGSGLVTGLRARPGLVIDVEWAAGKLARVEVRPVSPSITSTRLRYHGRTLDLPLTFGAPVVVTGAHFGAPGMGTIAPTAEEVRHAR